MGNPQARRFEHLRELDGELVVVDESNHVAHRLTGAAASIWRACDGATDRAGLAAAAGVDEATAAATLEHLQTLGLLEDDAPIPLDTRRSMLRKAVLTGAAVGAGGALVSSVFLPTPAQAFDSQSGGRAQDPPPDDGGQSMSPGAGGSQGDGSPGGGTGTPGTGTIHKKHKKHKHKKKHHAKHHKHKRRHHHKKHSHKKHHHGTKHKHKHKHRHG